MANRKKLNEKTVKAAKDAGITWDTDLTGFGLRVTLGKPPKGKTEPTVRRAFILNYRFQGRERRMVIGRYPVWSAESAREEANKLRRQVDTGTDPLAERKAADGASTLAEVWEHYEAEALTSLRPASREEYSLMWRKHIKPALGRLKAQGITKADVTALHRKLAKATPVRANRVLGVLSVLFSHAKDSMSIPVDNPVKGVKKIKENPRKRYLTDEEAERLAKTLADYPYMERHRLPKSEWFHEDGKLQKSRMVRRDKPHPAALQAANALRLIMLTGCRKGEALSATWSQFDLAGRTWTKPSSHTKQQETHRIPLSIPAVMLLQDIKKQSGKSPYLFPSGDSHQEDVKSAWTTIRHRAGIPDVRIHDLRHQFASVLVSAGQSLPVIGALLGHTRAETTQRYAHLFDEPLRAATEAAGAIIGGNPKAEVVNIKEARR